MPQTPGGQLARDDMAAGFHKITSLSDLLRDNRNVLIQEDELKIKHCLGEGAFAKVYLAEYQGRPVAVKKLKLEHLEDPVEVKLFLEEIRMMMSVRHPNIVELVGTGGSKDEKGEYKDLYVVQEVLEGKSLREIVQTQMITVHSKIYSLRQAIQWCLDVAQALTYLHSSNPKVRKNDDSVCVCVCDLLTGSPCLTAWLHEKPAGHSSRFEA